MWIGGSKALLRRRWFRCQGRGETSGHTADELPP
jgi:hypothetical protein